MELGKELIEVLSLVKSNERMITAFNLAKVNNEIPCERLYDRPPKHLRHLGSIPVHEVLFYERLDQLKEEVKNPNKL